MLKLESDFSFKTLHTSISENQILLRVQNCIFQYFYQIFLELKFCFSRLLLHFAFALNEVQVEVICQSVRQFLKLQLMLKAEAKIHKLATNFMHFSSILRQMAL